MCVCVCVSRARIHREAGSLDLELETLQHVQLALSQAMVYTTQRETYTALHTGVEAVVRWLSSVSESSAMQCVEGDRDKRQCVYVRADDVSNTHTHTHAYTHKRKAMCLDVHCQVCSLTLAGVSVWACVCVCVCVSMCTDQGSVGSGGSRRTGLSAARKALQGSTRI